MNGYIQRSKGDSANGTHTDRQARRNGPCPAHGQENRKDQSPAKDDSRGMRGIGQDSQKSDSEPRRRRRLYVSEDGTRCDTDTALEREWKSGAEASFRSDRNSGSALGARHDTEHEAGRRGKTRSRKVFEGKGKKKGNYPVDKVGVVSMAREDLKPVRTKEEAKRRGRAGGIASAAARREKKSFEATLKAILDTPMEELESLSPRLAICKGMIMKAAAGDKPAADWVRDTVGEKPVDKQELSGSLDVVSVIEEARRRANGC